MSNGSNGNDQAKRKPLTLKLTLGDLVLFEIEAQEAAKAARDALAQLGKVINPEDLFRALRGKRAAYVPPKVTTNRQSLDDLAKEHAQREHDRMKDTPGPTYCGCPACDLRRLLQEFGK